MALGLAIAIERFVFLTTRAQREPQALGRSCCRCCRSGQFKDVQGVTSNSDAAVGKIVDNGLHAHAEPGPARGLSTRRWRKA